MDAQTDSRRTDAGNALSLSAQKKSFEITVRDKYDTEENTLLLVWQRRKAEAREKVYFELERVLLGLRND